MRVMQTLQRNYFPLSLFSLERNPSQALLLRWRIARAIMLPVHFQVRRRLTLSWGGALRLLSRRQILIHKIRHLSLHGLRLSSTGKLSPRPLDLQIRRDETHAPDPFDCLLLVVPCRLQGRLLQL